MTAVWFRFRAELRGRWRALLALSVLVGIAGGAVLVAAAGARRTDSAFDRLIAATEAWDVLVNPDFGDDSELSADDVLALPMVAEGARMDGIALTPLGDQDSPEDTGIVFALHGAAGYGFARPKVNAGRMPDPSRADEMFVTESVARRHHWSVGSTVPSYVLGAGAIDAIDSGAVPADEINARIESGELGSKVTMRVTGIGVLPDGIVVDEGFSSDQSLVSPAFTERHPDAGAGYFGVIVRLRDGTHLDAFRDAVQAIPHEGSIEFQTNAVTRAKVDRAVRPHVGALSLFAIVLGVTALLLIGQAIARQMFLDSVDHPALRALGASRLQLALTSLLRATVVAAVGALLAVVVAIVASPLMPIGPARVAEPDPGISVDGLVLGAGGVLVFASVVLIALGPAWWYSRSATFARADDALTRRSRLAGWVRTSGGPLPAATGVGMALEPGRGSTAVPVRTTIVGASVALATVVGAFTFAASLDHLVSTPRLFGWAWDVRVDASVDTEAQVAARETIVDDIRASDAVAGFADTAISTLVIDGVPVTTLGLGESRGGVGPTVVSGRVPRGDREIALGAKTLERLGVAVGDTVRVQPPNREGGERAKPERLRVVGRVVLPGFGTYQGSDKTALGEGAVTTLGAVRDLGPDFGAGPVLVKYTSNADRGAFARAVRDREAAAFSVSLSGLQRPSDIVSYERVRSTPFVLAGLLAVVAIAIVSHALVTVVRRRRRDLALLKTLGFTRRQVSASVAWQATTIGVAALVVGIPLGVLLGRWAWTTLADDLGTVAEPLVPVALLVLAVPVVLLIVNAVAFVPGRLAAALRPARALRSE